MTFANVGLLVQHSYSEFCIRFTGQGPSSLVHDGGASAVTGVGSVTLDIMKAQAEPASSATSVWLYGLVLATPFPFSPSNGAMSVSPFPGRLGHL